MTIKILQKILISLAKKSFTTKILSLFEAYPKNLKHKYNEFGLYKYDYNIPNNCGYEPDSINIGDYIQSLAAKQYLPDTQIPVLIDRDKIAYYNGQNIDLIANAWYWIHDGNIRFSDKINPLLVAVHLNNLYTIPKETLNYLKQHEPIGCRDYTTRNFLMFKGIKAYFSSCLTTTLDLKYKQKDNKRKNTIIFCDYTIDETEQNRTDTELKKILAQYANYTIEHTKHSYPLGTDIGECFTEAENLIKKYATAKLVITTRIHCALPCLALGTPVILILKNYDKFRYNGISQLLNVIGTNKHKKFVCNIKTNSEGLVVNSAKYKTYADKLKKIVSEYTV